MKKIENIKACNKEGTILKIFFLVLLFYYYYAKYLFEKNLKK